MKKITIVVFVLLSLIWPGGLFGLSSATLDGTMGLVEMPTAFTLEENQFYLGTDYSNIAFWNPAQKISEKKDLWYTKFILTTFRDLELGVIGESGREGLFLNLKYYLINPTVSGPIALALGLDNLSSFNRSGIYMVASKRFSQYWALHLGFKAELPAQQDIFFSGMLGAEYNFNSQFKIISDFRLGNNLSRFNSGVRFLLFDNIIINLSGLNLFDNVRGISAGIGLINSF